MSNFVGLSAPSSGVGAGGAATNDYAPLTLTGNADIVAKPSYDRARLAVDLGLGGSLVAHDIGGTGVSPFVKGSIKSEDALSATPYDSLNTSAGATYNNEGLGALNARIAMRNYKDNYGANTTSFNADGGVNMAPEMALAAKYSKDITANTSNAGVSGKYTFSNGGELAANYDRDIETGANNYGVNYTYRF